ncbi:serine protease [Sphingobium sufflavum]|uniref:trypsin-like serine peptidase n=1 Tax=Sphingobium sufflavum TaxID=1129547 RepID=UPI001F312A00|nr:serine protease [Sphingobium sufflavum]MCE7796377.1 serine protease [Sphingobium sufflavum]
MWTPDDIANAIVDHPQEATDVLAALQLEDHGPPLEAEGLNAAARMLGREVGQFWVEQIEGRGALAGFAAGLATRGVAIDFGQVDLEATHVNSGGLNAFTERARGFRCRIIRDSEVAGSGVLIGPTTVLTAWHVVSPREPGQPPDPRPRIMVSLSDGRTVGALPMPLFESPCSPREFAGFAPKDDAETANACDVAVIRLERPVGALLGAAALPGTPASYRPNASMFLIHYPDGAEAGAAADDGVGVGAISRLRRVRSRWSHSIGTRKGSSGGGCFDASFTIAGVHQGKDNQVQGRLIPTAQFHAQVREVMVQDQAPDRMWSLDGTAEGEFVINRQAFFEGFAAARRPGRVRGIWIRRANAAGDLSGLPFSFRMLDRMVARSPDTRQCRISFEALVPDIADEIARRVHDSGIAVEPIAPRAGVSTGESAPEAVGADRGRRVAEMIDRSAAALGVQLWLFIDHPMVAFGDDARAALEGFIDQAMRLPNLRLVIAGFEAVSLPGLGFTSAPFPIDVGAPGLMLDIIAGFTANSVRLFLLDAAAAAGKALSTTEVDGLIAQALDGLPQVNGVYEPWLAADVGVRLRPAIRGWFT